MTSIPSDDQPQQRGPYGQRGPVTSDELLPPVEPPTAGFIIQLFVVPAVIVAAVVLVWFLIESLARRGEQDPDEIVAGLRSSNQARFQRAQDLANMLRLPQRYPELKTNRELASKLAAYLDELVEAGDESDAAVSMRDYLTAALGEFYVADGLPVLIRAALEDPNREIRRRAINSIAVLTNSLANLKPPQRVASDQLVEALGQLADDEDEVIRSEAAFTIGVLAAYQQPDPRLVAALEELADDPYTDARFNAATALARVGSPLAGPAVAEMLDLESIESSLAGEKAMTLQMSEREVAANRAFKRKVIITGALKSIDTLLDKPALPAGTFVPLRDALKAFLPSIPKLGLRPEAEKELRQAAERTLSKVAARAADARE